MYIVSEYCLYDLHRFLFLRGPFLDEEMREVRPVVAHWIIWSRVGVEWRSAASWPLATRPSPPPASSTGPSSPPTSSSRSAPHPPITIGQPPVSQAKWRSRFHLKLSDFGLGRFYQQAYGNGLTGPTAYMAPEVRLPSLHHKFLHQCAEGRGVDRG